MNNNLFTNECVSSKRTIYTCSPFARSSLLFLQETGTLQAKRPHVSSRQNLQSYLFFVVLDGSGWLEYNGVMYELCESDVCFIDCRKGYSQSSSETLWHLSWCHWSGNNMPAVYNKWTERGGKPVFHLDDPAPFVSLLDELYATVSSEDFVRDIHINEHLTKLVSLLMEQTVYDENMVYQDGALAFEITTRADRIDVREVKSYIDSHYKETLSLEGLADQTFVNKNYLARLFKEMFGMSVGGYIQLVRIEKAKELLRFTDMGIEKIGYECDYNDLNYFNRAFKKVEGCSPSEFRRNHMSRKE